MPHVNDDNECNNECLGPRNSYLRLRSFFRFTRGVVSRSPRALGSLAKFAKPNHQPADAGVEICENAWECLSDRVPLPKETNIAVIICRVIWCIRGCFVDSSDIPFVLLGFCIPESSLRTYSSLHSTRRFTKRGLRSLSQRLPPCFEVVFEFFIQNIISSLEELNFIHILYLKWNIISSQLFSLVSFLNARWNLSDVDIAHS